LHAGAQAVPSVTGVEAQPHSAVPPVPPFPPAPPFPPVPDEPPTPLPPAPLDPLWPPSPESSDPQLASTAAAPATKITAILGMGRRSCLRMIAPQASRMKPSSSKAAIRVAAE
jgi:hypothetical protein